LAVSAQEYLNASRERLDDARVLHDNHSYVLAHYAAGVAVECILRAYRHRINPEFDSRHNLYLLAKEARFDEVIPKDKYDYYAALLSEVTQMWFNNIRYYDDDGLRRHLKQFGSRRQIKGDVLKESSRSLFDAAEKVVLIGVARWKQ
jgi:hypothetical protein